jgi:hypothetical protein
MRKVSKKLSLDTTTIRQLSGAEMGGVQGGYTLIIGTLACATNTCKVLDPGSGLTDCYGDCKPTAYNSCECR